MWFTDFDDSGGIGSHRVFTGHAPRRPVNILAQLRGLGFQCVVLPEARLRPQKVRRKPLCGSNRRTDPCVFCGQSETRTITTIQTCRCDRLARSYSFSSSDGVRGLLSVENTGLFGRQGTSGAGASLPLPPTRGASAFCRGCAKTRFSEPAAAAAMKRGVFAGSLDFVRRRPQAALIAWIVGPTPRLAINRFRL